MLWFPPSHALRMRGTSESIALVYGLIKFSCQGVYDSLRELLMYQELLFIGTSIYN